MTNVDIGNNLVTNPSLKTTTSGWYNSIGSVVKSSVGGRFQVAAGNTAPAFTQMASAPGYKYALTGVRFKRASGSALFGVAITFHNAANVQIGNATWQATSNPTGTWFTAPRLEATAPALTKYVRVYVTRTTTTYAFDFYATNFILKRYVVAPVLSAGTDQTKVQGETATLTATPTAGDGTISTYKWEVLSQSAGDTPALSSTTTASTDLGPIPSIGTTSLKATITDSYGLTAFDTVDVVTSSGPAPVADAGPSQTIYQGGTATLAGSEVSAAGIASRLWTATGGATITSPTSATTAVGPLTALGEYTFTYMATDVNSKAGTDTVVVTVIAAPTSTAINARTRLEVRADDVDNLIENHSGQDGVTTGWSPGGGCTISATSGNAFGYEGNALELTSASNTDLYLESGYFPALPNEFFEGSVILRTADIGTDVVWVNTSLVFLDASYNWLEQVGARWWAVEDNLETEAILHYSSAAPADTAYVMIAIYAYNFDTLPPVMYLYNAQLIRGTTSGSVENISFSGGMGDYWQNILGKSLSVGTSRGANLDGVTDKLEAGLLTAVVVDPFIAPDKSTRVRPGKDIRLSAFNNGTSEWEPVWTGSITEANATYRKRKPVITITATDAVTDLSNLAVPSAVSGAFRQRVNAALDGSPVLYETTDTDSDTTSAVLSIDEQGTGLSQLEMARNSLHGIIYVDKTNTLQAYASNSLPTTTPVVTFSDRKSDVGAILYADIDVNFGSKALVNTISVEKHDNIGEYGQYTYGPYLNAQSVSDWGTQGANLVINDGDPVTQAGYYLSTFANPTIFCNSVTFRSDNNLSQSIGLELYQAARVKFADAGLDAVYRIIAIEHEVLPDSWETTVYFRPLEATASVTVSVPALGAYTGPVDLLPAKPVGTGTLLSPFTSSTIQFQRVGNIVIATGYIIRASGFSTSMTNAIVIPDGFKPTVASSAPGSTFTLGSAAWYQIDWTTTHLRARQTAANANGQWLNATWITTDPYP